MNTQKPTEAVDVRELIAHLKGIFSMSLRDFGLSASYSDAAANHVLTGISAAGYVIVPRVPTEAMLNNAVTNKAWQLSATAIYTAMIAAAENGE